VEFLEQSGSLMLVALDLMDGHVIFKCPLGTMLQMRRARDDPRGWDEFWEQTEPAVAGELVVVCPNVGMAAAVGRFDGKIKWTRSYDEKMVIIGRGRERRDDGERGRERLPVPEDINELLRFRGTPEICGETIVLAPQDSASAFALDLRNGTQIWKLDSAPATALIGKQGSVAIFCGDSVEGIEAASGKNKWHYSPTAPARITGPATVVGGVVYIPVTNSKIVTLSADSGRVVSATGNYPTLKQMLGNEQARKILDDAMILRTFGPPGVNPTGDVGRSP
jgi:glucose dehydrogenase